MGKERGEGGGGMREGKGRRNERGEGGWGREGEKMSSHYVLVW